MEIAAAVNDILATGILTLGPYTRQFEDAFAAAHGGAASRLEAVATSSGMSALQHELELGEAGAASGRPADVVRVTFAMLEQSKPPATSPTRLAAAWQGSLARALGSIGL
jgi:perosamine synthetase